MWRSVIGKFAVGVLVATLLSGCGEESFEKNPDSGTGTSPAPAPPPSSAPSYTLSGTIYAAAANMTDSDVNDPATADVSNDSRSQAQQIPNPVIVGGYANIAGAGASGNLSVAGDTSDFYHSYLAEGQTVSLKIADDDPYINDLNLRIYNESGTLEWASTSTGKLESITIPTGRSGNYYIEVFAYSNAYVGGASNYFLSISQTAVLADGQAMSIDAEFVPGEVIVKYRENSARESQLLAHSTGMSVGSSFATGATLLRLPEDPQAASQALDRLGVSRKQASGSAISTQAQRKMDTLAAIAALRKRKEVLYAEPNYLRHANGLPTDEPLYGDQWHYPLINLPAAWGTTQGSGGVTVAVVDTGVLLDHPDLAGQLVTGYDFISDISNAVDGNGIDSDPNDPGDRWGETENSSFHGTHVAGTVAANSSNGIGVAGVAGGVKIMPLRVLGTQGGTSRDIMQAVLYAAGLPNDSGSVPSQPADIINLSLGGGSYSAAEQEIYDLVRAAGVIVIAAAGNSGDSSPSYPAAYSGVISVSSVIQDETLAFYSSYGPTISVAAPGGNGTTAGGVWSLMGNDLNYNPTQGGYFNYAALSGTSMASPHVAGVVALMKSIYPALNPINLDGLLACSELITKDIGVAGRDDSFGYGLIDAEKAVDVASSLTTTTPTCSMLQATPSQLNFGTSSSSLLLQVSDAGAAGAAIASVVDSAAWLTVAEAAVDPVTKLGSYTVTANRSLLGADGIYHATIQFTSAEAETLTVPVSIQKATASLEDNAGYLYLFLVDATTDETVGYLGRAATNARYPFSFGSVPAGDYYIVAGTDNNNDGYVCEPGEACGLYSSGSGGVVFSVTGNTAGLDFEVGYGLFVGGADGAQLQQKAAMRPRAIVDDKRY